MYSVPTVEKKKKKKRQVSSAIVNIKTSFNNTLVNITDYGGNVLVWSSAGVVGFKGTKKSTPFAAQMVAEDISKKAKEHGISTLAVNVVGPGAGRDVVIKTLRIAGFKITSISDITPIPHNGCRAPKRRRG